MVYGNHPCDFFCHLIEESQNFADLIGQLEAAYSSSRSSFFIVAILCFINDILLFHLDGSKQAIVGPQNGMACVVQFAGNWCRGKITKIVNEKDVEVILVDFGIIAYIDKTFVMEMEQEFVRLPPQAHHCSLQGVQSTWALQPNTKFEQATSNKELMATFNGRSNNRKYSVILNEHRNGSYVVINKLFIPTRPPNASNSRGVKDVAKKNPPQITQVNVYFVDIFRFSLSYSIISSGNNRPTHL